METIRQNLLRGDQEIPPLAGRRIHGVTLRWPRHVVKPSTTTFRRRTKGRLIDDVGRRGKYLLLKLDQGWILIHLGMSGDLRMAEVGEPNGRYDHTVFNLDQGWQLRFSDARKFGKVYLTDKPESILGRLGPEPLDPHFTGDSLATRLATRRRALKPLLLDQRFMAGVGNIYADEALHIAGLHPLRRSDGLTRPEVEGLLQAIRAALRAGLRHNGASIDWVYRGGDFQRHFRVYGRSGEPCLTCGREIKRIVVAQRGTHFCPHCQPEAAA